MKKRILSMLLVMAMVISCVVIPVSAAENVVISTEKAVPGYPVSVTVDGAVPAGETTISWYASDTEDGTYELISEATGNNWAITNACENKYIKACIDGEYSNALLVGAGLDITKVSNNQAMPADMPAESPAEYKFTLANPGTTHEYTYHMLETEEVDGKTQYFILQLGDYISNGYMTANETDRIFDPSVSKSAADWLNNVWAVSTDNSASTAYYQSQGGALRDNSKVIDTNIKDYLQNHTWLTERTGSAYIPNDYTFKGKVAFLSVTEFFKHYKKIGKNDFNDSWLRTPANHTDNARFWAINASNQWKWLYNKNASYNMKYRPVYYLSEDFFKNVKLNVDDLGEVVLAAVLEENENSEALLREIGYTTGELVRMGVVAPPVEPVASEVSISVEKAVPGYPVKVNYKYSHSEGKEQGNTKIYWYASTAENGTYEKIQGAEGNDWPIWNICEEQYIKAKVVPRTFDDIEASEDYFSENVIKVGEGLKAFNPDTDGGWNLPSDMPEESPAEYKFFLKTPLNPGFTYHMLESETQDGEGRFLILQMGSMISNGRMTSDAANYKFDPTVKYSVAGWLNDVWAESASPGIKDYYNSGGNGPLNNNATAIDSNIKPYLVKHTWLTENSGGSLVPNDFIFEAKVTLLSTTEFFKHYHKFGKTDYGKAWLRTPTENNGQAKYYLINASSNAWAKNGGSESNIHYYRPVYYLSEDFFKDVRLDTEAVGTEVAKMIRSVIPKEEMLSGKAKYTEEELTTVFGYPEKTGYVENVVISGNLSVGETLTAQYDFNKNGLDKDKSDQTRYQWYRADNKDGEFQLINNADNKEYIITEDDLEKFLAVEVTVINEEGEMCTPGMGVTGISISNETDIKNEFVSLSEQPIDAETKKATATLEVTNDSGNRVLTFVIAAYDSQNMMCDFNMQDILVESGTDDYEIYLTDLGLSNDYKYRVMVLDNSNNLRPLYVGEI